MKRISYKQRQIVTTNMEKNVKEEFEELAWNEKKSFAEKLQEVMREELQRKKAVGSYNPIAVSYGFEDNSNSRQSLILEFQSVPDAYHALQDRGIHYEDLNKMEQYCRNFLDGIKSFKPNASRKVITK